MSSRKPPLPTFHCISCKKDITNKIMIICAECEETLLCTDCFSKGAEIGKHKSNHNYQLFPAPINSLYSLGWTLEDETKLIESLTKNGFGNWQEVSKTIGKKSKGECEEHYKKTYLGSSSFSYPEPLESFGSEQKESASGLKGNKTNVSANLTAREIRHQKFLKKRQMTQLSYPKFNPYDQNYPRGKSIFADYAGWMPKRKELEFEWDQDAEKVTNTFGFRDNGIDWDLKYNVLRGVDERIKQREEKKDFVINMGLLYPKSIIEGDMHERPTRKERQFQSKMRVFARSLKNREQFDQVLDSFFTEFKLKSEINRLLEWRQLGFTSFSEGERYQNQKKEIFTKARRGKRKLKSRSKTLPISSSSSPTNNTSSFSKSDKGNSFQNFDTSNTQLNFPLSPNSSFNNINNQLLIDSQEFLSEAEKSLCKQIGMQNFQYIFIKNHYLCGVPLQKIPNLLNTQIESLQSFFSKNEWL
ncbi:transcriptional adapter 2-alpha [Anaeramoeba flamelloides]|uniref:Transcriptional adapter 2-alpha n=1 Tax=Anaeramoeba flamelloides TaxID=1746091 RepID=A0ABQ8YTL5_9EUKA|nr:transcriptional adapter 2-alpha [Anaeramoeba flamelloides]